MTELANPQLTIKGKLAWEIGGDAAWPTLIPAHREFKGGRIYVTEHGVFGYTHLFKFEHVEGPNGSAAVILRTMLAAKVAHDLRVNRLEAQVEFFSERLGELWRQGLDDPRWQGLWEWMGLSSEEYSAWVEDPSNWRPPS